MNDTSKKGLIILAIFATGAAVGRFSLPAKIVEKEHIVYQDKIIEKQVQVTDVKTKNHKIYVKLEKTSPDGTKTVETRIMDDVSSQSNSKTASSKTEDIAQTTDKEKTTTYSKQDTIISLLASPSINSSTPGLSMGLSVQERILGPIYIGGFGLTNGSVGGSIGIGF